MTQNSQLTEQKTISYSLGCKMFVGIPSNLKDGYLGLEGGGIQEMLFKGTSLQVVD